MFILVLSQFEDESDEWCLSAASGSRSTLEALPCYDDPPSNLSKSAYRVLKSWPLPRALKPCGRPDAAALPGTIYQLEAVEEDG